MTNWRCDECEQRSCRLTCEEGMRPEFCPNTGWKEHPRGGGARWYHCDESGRDLTDDDIDEDLLSRALAKDD